ncbi:hypothetical protein [Stutzerimonas nitrititolerans]|uniref:Morphogenetic protein n=1 Tax=Stutzerimonas nitrititolerans TaxID=2482751 RepID=A0ABX9V3X2_9GAMM|nr:hypothetical protein [Stutzerimonas nitrititolerans]RMI00496.1 hypothetical protein EA795_13330 [Stutzerimonas nitrititolerans]
MSEQKERPILFNGAMVRAILEGRKTVTRRAIKPAPQMVTDSSIEPWSGDPAVLMRLLEKSGKCCPFGQPGDRLWVRETWQGPLLSDDEMRADPGWWKDMSRYQNPAHCAYRASGDSCEFVDPDGDMQCRWKPSIHMPRWASRIQLEITDVRVERLQAITYEQAAAEGIHRDHRMWFATDEGGPAFINPEAAFAQLWRQTGGDFDSNPWVWVVEFKRVNQHP